MAVKTIRLLPHEFEEMVDDWLIKTFGDELCWEATQVNIDAIGSETILTLECETVMCYEDYNKTWKDQEYG